MKTGITWGVAAILVVSVLAAAWSFLGPRARVGPAEEEAAVADPNLVVSAYDPDRAYDGTTLLTDSHDATNLRIVEVNMDGEVVWEYAVPRSLVKGQPVGFDAERLANGNVLFVLSGSGVYEVDRDGTTAWSYADAEVSHDADRLANGNTLVNFGNNDKRTDAQIKEISPEGEVVWEWYAKDAYGASAYADSDREGGWTHANAVERLGDGNTMVSLRNFYLTTILDESGTIVREFDWSGHGTETDPHEPEIHEGEGTLLTCLQKGSPYVAVEIDMRTEEPTWTYVNKGLRTARDCDKLPNGNVLIVAVDTGGTLDDQADDYSTVIEVAPDGEVVWRLDLVNFPASKSPGYFFKAQRIAK